MARRLQTAAPPWDVHFFEAQDALQGGVVAPVQRYLENAAELIINLLARDISPGAHAETDVVEEWYGTVDQVREAIEQGKSELVREYLRDLSSFLALLA